MIYILYKYYILIYYFFEFNLKFFILIYLCGFDFFAYFFLIKFNGLIIWNLKNNFKILYYILKVKYLLNGNNL